MKQLLEAFQDRLVYLICVQNSDSTGDFYIMVRDGEYDVRCDSIGLEKENLTAKEVVDIYCQFTNIE